MIEAELVIGAADGFREDVIWTVALAFVILMHLVD